LASAKPQKNTRRVSESDPQERMPGLPTSRTWHVGMAYSIPFNKPFFAGRELDHIAQAVAQGDVSGNGRFTRRYARLIEERPGIARGLLTPSCTAALELAASVCNLGPGPDRLRIAARADTARCRAMPDRIPGRRADGSRWLDSRSSRPRRPAPAMERRA
jgi:hypothetical protein